MIDYEISRRLCVLRFNRPPLNTIDQALLGALREAIARAENDSAADALVLIGSAEHFSAGADIHIFETIHSEAEARALSQEFQQAFGRIEECSKPVVAGLAGRVMGGALELALACHLRVAARDAQLSLPEVRLGILPGAGGTQRLPRIIGPAKALEAMLTGRPIGAAEAQRLGLVDAVCPGEELIDGARRLLQSGQPARRSRDRTERLGAGDLESAIAQAEATVRTLPPELLAPRRIIACLSAGARGSFNAGLSAEREAFAECVLSPAAQNRFYAFFATRQTGKLPELAGVETREIDQAAVVGMGSMGTGIAQALAAAGVSVTVFDQDPAATERGLGRIRQSLERRVADGKMAAAQAEAALARIAPAGEFAALGAADLVIESVFELLEVKRAVLRQIEAVCGDETILATNTSTLSLDALAEGLRIGERLIGMHFFNPAHSMPLVEVVRRKGTSQRVAATTLRFAKRLGKTPIVVNNREGFLVNRVFVPYLAEAFSLLEEGASPRQIDSAMVQFGFPMGPLTLSDMTGIDIVVHAHRELQKAFPYHGPLSQVAHRLVALGRTGQKGGAGVYRYEPGSRTALDDGVLGAAVADVQRSKTGAGPNGFKPPLSAGELTRRLVGRMIAEAFRVLEENVARSEADLDAAMILGTGFPDYRGGIVRYARSRGLDTVCAELENLTETCSERFAPSRYLRTLART